MRLMTIEEKMDHFRSLSLESASSKSAESLSSYKQSLDDDLELHKETASQLAEESKKALMNQVRANSKKKLSSEQMKIKKELTQKQSAIKIEVFDRVREKLLEYRKTNDYLVYLENQIKNIMSEYSDIDITIYIDRSFNDIWHRSVSYNGNKRGCNCNSTWTVRFNGCIHNNIFCKTNACKNKNVIHGT